MPVLLAASIAVPIGLLLFAAWVNYRQAEDAAFQSARYTATALTEHALRTVRGHELVIEFVAGHIQGMSWPQVRQSARLYRLLQRVVESYDDIDSVVLLAPDGTTALSSRAFPTPPLDASDRDYFARLRAGDPLFISRPGIGRLSKERYFSLARPVLDKDGQFNGVIAVAVNPRYFEAFYKSLLLPTEAASLLREDGVVLARHPPVKELVHVLPASSSLMQALHGSEEGTVAARSFTDGLNRIFAYKRVGEYPFYATFQLAGASLWAQWRSAMLPYVLASLLAFIGLLAATGLAQQRARRAMAEQHQRDAEEASRAKDRFVATLSHEIRNPLAAISGASELLQRNPASVGIASEIIARQLEHMRAILDDLLDTARTVFGKLNLEKRRLDLYALAREIVDERAARNTGPVRFALEGVSAWVDADPNRLRQIIDNLLENAVRYGARRITVSVKSDPECHELAVADDGEGIPSELLPRLFQPFVQGEQALDRAQGGLGLGLALVSHFARLHGGRVAASSEGRGRGSCFRVFLPRADAPARTPAKPARPAQAARRRIVLVDDQADTRAMLRELLAGAGHEVITAANGPDGLEALAQAKPDVALLDIGLPGMDGYELARRARAAQGGRPLFLVAITGYGRADDREMALEAGFDAHLTKPFTFDSLMEAIDADAVSPASAATTVRASHG